MEQVKLTVRKAYVFDEVRKASEYIGKKLVTPQDPDAYARLSLTDADNLMLERLWQEGCQMGIQSLKRYLSSVNDFVTKGNTSDLSKNLEVTLDMPDNFDVNLVPGIESSLSSYIVTTMLAKWCLVANRPDAQAYMELSNVSLQDINKKLFKRNRPVRP